MENFLLVKSMALLCESYFIHVKVVGNVWPVSTELFISPSGISDSCGTVARMVTPKGSMSTEVETLQVSVLPYRCTIC